MWRCATTFICLVLFAAVPASAGAVEGHASVIDGSPAAEGQFPFMAFVYFENSEEASACSGALVSSNIVLTAAHCVVNVETGVIHRPERFTVVTGTTDWTSPARVVSQVTRLAIHPNFARGGIFALYGDAAILQLSAPVSSPAVTLATSPPAPGTTGLVAGWGKTSAEQESVSAQLAFGSTVVQTSGYCEAQFGLSFHPTGEFCSLDYPSFHFGTCNGDSGGPLLAPSPTGYVEIGITSHGPDGCPTDRPRVDTRADFVAGWVDTKIAELAPPPALPAAPPSPTPPRSTAAPKTQALPRLSGTTAKAFAREVLTDALGGRFTRRRSYRITCIEVDPARQRCSVSWWMGASDYWGAVTVYYASEGGQVAWDDHYAIRKVGDYCYWHSGHRASCPIRTFRR